MADLFACLSHQPGQICWDRLEGNRAACLLSLLKPYLRIFRGLSKLNLPGYVGFCQFLWNFRRQNAFEQAEMILPAA